MKNQYKPEETKIKEINISGNLATIKLIPGKLFNPGQFFMLSIPGFGEAPFTPTNYAKKNEISFLVRRAGTFTTQIFKLKKNDKICIRGPYGNGFTLEKFKNKNITLIAGGCGIAPLASALEYLYKNYKSYKNIQLFYGVNTYKDLSLKKEISSKKDRIEILFTIAKPHKGYKGNVGFITSLINKNTILKNTIAIICGPSAMYEKVISNLIGSGVKINDIYLQLERRMHCGVGLCQHCTCGKKYVCTDGPVFCYQDLLQENEQIF